MPIHCPYCREAVVFQAAEPGRFTARCAKCGKKFLVGIPQDQSKPAVVSALKSELEGRETVATTPHATAPHTSPVATQASPSAGPKGAPEVEATGVWGAGSGEEASATQAHRPTRSPASAPAAATSEMGFDVDSELRSNDAALRAPSSDVPSALGGYQVLKELGRGGMGAVYLARQLSLDRNVALKVMRSQWAEDPQFVARFTREAYAAAHLSHHNVVQIYDLGEDRGTNYFSMEFVDGQTLSDLVRQKKKLDVEEAVGYVLQAARGLKFAHDQGMIHRDIKPENLLLNRQGIVKVADLGLVKIPATAEDSVPERTNPRASAVAESAESDRITRADVAMGTPAFMAPEQAKDAASVDHRADIYSLGCTLYTLVTGRPPFEGRTTMEVLTKHQSEPIVPPELIVKRVPKSLSIIIQKMVAKRPEDRYADLGDVIRTLEEFLGIQGSGPFTPREEHAELLERSVAEFNAAPSARLHRNIILGALAGSALLVIVFALARKPLLAGGLLGLVVMTGLAAFVIDGVTRKSHLFRKTREFAFGRGLSDWLMGLAGLVLFVTLLVVFGVHWVWLAGALVAVGLAFALHATIDRKVDAEHRGPIENVEQMLRSMRLLGLEEDALRQFVCKYGGNHWEEFYEALFGYEAKLAAREHWGLGDRAKPLARYGVWRDPLVTWMDAKIAARREEKDRKTLQKIEEKSLQAQGENLLTARRKAQRAAEAIVTMASEMKAAPPGRRDLAKALREAAKKPEVVLKDRETGLTLSRSSGPLDLIAGPKVRFLAGAALLGGCLLWMHQNGIISETQLKQAAETVAETTKKAVETQDVEALRAVQDAVKVDTSKATHPLRFPVIPPSLLGLFNSLNPGVAGLFLLVSSFFRGARMSLFAFPAAIVTLLGPRFGVPSIGPMDASLSSMWLGLGVMVLGFFFGRSRR